MCKELEALRGLGIVIGMTITMAIGATILGTVLEYLVSK
jgi:hypothetical protein